jgi:hypothetical protein
MKTKAQQKAIDRLISLGLLEAPPEEPIETKTDLIREIQSVVSYYYSRGQGFTEKPCKQCGLVFAYSWDHDSIAYCSIRCANQALQEIGLEWTLSKPPAERWGRTIPAVVPPQALALVGELLKEAEDALPEDEPVDTSHEASL